MYTNLVDRNTVSARLSTREAQADGVHHPLGKYFQYVHIYQNDNDDWVYHMQIVLSSTCVLSAIDHVMCDVIKSSILVCFSIHFTSISKNFIPFSSSTIHVINNLSS